MNNTRIFKGFTAVSAIKAEKTARTETRPQASIASAPRRTMIGYVSKVREKSLILGKKRIDKIIKAQARAAITMDGHIDISPFSII